MELFVPAMKTCRMAGRRAFRGAQSRLFVERFASPQRWPCFDDDSEKIFRIRRVAAIARQEKHATAVLAWPATALGLARTSFRKCAESGSGCRAAVTVLASQPQAPRMIEIGQHCRLANDRVDFFPLM